MALSKTVYTKFVTLQGTLAEVAQALSDNGIPNSKIVAMYYDQGSSNHVAVYSTI